MNFIQYENEAIMEAERKIDRFDIYMQANGLNDNQVTKILDLSVGTISKSRKENRDLSDGVVEKILNKFHDLNRVWLLTGEGSMINISQDENITSLPISVEEQGKPIPFVNQTAVAGFGGRDFAIAERDVKAYYVVPKFKHCHIDFMIEISGSSMYPKYNSGDVVACTILKESRFIQWNKCHVIATKEQGILVKRLLPGETPDCIKAVSDNDKYPPFEIPKDEITGIAIIAGVIRLE